MRYDDDGIVKVDQELLEPVKVLQVQMVGRLIQEKHTGVLGQELGQKYPLQFSTGQGQD